MESGLRVTRKGRKLGSSRRRQMREPADGQDAPVAPEPESWSSQSAEELQSFFQDCGAEERGFVTREDLAVAKFSFLSSEDELEMIFDWVDVERKGRLSLEEFSSGLKNIFGSSSSSHRLHRKRPLLSKRGSVATSFPVVEEANSEEKEAFFAFMEQLGASNSLPEQAEIWQLWRTLRQEEPQLAGNLEGFLAKMNSRLQEAQADKEVLELTLRKRDTDHHREVQQLYEEMEQQIQREKQQLQAESDSRGLALSSQMQEVLEAKEREVQRLTEGQKELEAQLHRLSSTHQEASSENRQLREAERDLAGRLEEVRGQLQVTRGQLHAARGRVSWQVEEELSPPEQTGEPPSPEPREESRLGPGVHIPWGLPGVPAGESGSLVAGALKVLVPLEDGAPPQLTSPPPQSSAWPEAWFQTSHLEPHVPLFAQEPSSDPRGSPRSPPVAPSGTEEEEEVNPDGLDTSPPEQTGEPPSPEPREESQLVLGIHFPWGLPGVPAGESGSLVAAGLEVLAPLEDGVPPQVTSHPPQASAGPSAQFRTSYPDDESPDPGSVPPKPPQPTDALLWDPHSAGFEPRPGSLGAGALPVGLGEPSQGLVPGGPAPMDGWEQGKRSPDAQKGHSKELQEAHGRVPGLPAFLPWSLEEEPGAEKRKAGDQGDQQFRSELTIEVRGLKPEDSELPQLDSQPAPGPPDRMQAEAEAEALAPRKPSRGFARMGPQPGDGTGPPEPTQTLPTRAELEAQPRPRPTTTHAEGEQAPSKSREQRAEIRPEDPRTDSGGPGLTPSPGDRAASEPLANPDYAFHVIFLGDANVGKTSFLHLLHQNSFATGLTATVGVDFRVKNLVVDNKRFALQLWDTAGQERYHSVTRQLLRKADGVVLMYDITSQESFVHVRYWLDCLQDAESDDVVILLLGNKTDREDDRQVSTEAGQQLAQNVIDPVCGRLASHCSGLSCCKPRALGCLSPVTVAPGL
ncbi:hypothetical protein FD755_022118 [Muntiacus reevesi]|uniref:EF-hand domain-containing protein n=1 Tax=Muntiacus reevesi TaxID=9886 RepID=A0A5N3VZE6_MUNRE|nr:hypothetical protein FD755_022118 [Muntiacus reevesi]